MVRTIITVTDHDDRQLNFEEKNYLSDLGVPLDFTENDETVKQILKQCSRVLVEAKNKSRWIQVLISMHLDFLYEDLTDNRKQIKQFLKDQKDLRKKILREINVSLSEAKRSYEILRFCDRLSLILCKDQVPTIGRKLEINCSIDGKEYFIYRNDNKHLSITPWIFTSPSFELSTEERIMQKTSFKSQTEFEEQLNSTSASYLTWNFRKS